MANHQIPKFGDPVVKLSEVAVVGNSVSGGLPTRRKATNLDPIDSLRYA
jgi:hypothetical protein